MFWMKKKNDGKPESIPAYLARLIGDEWGKLPRNGDHWAEYLMVTRPRSGGSEEFEVRIFDKWYATEKNVQVLDYSSLDANPDLVLLEGFFSKKTKKGSIKARKTA
ncbi:MAG: hypothetical protein C4576_08000 [Desulfobacteraceae bacterium]|nr:MAG: hypothetical protein C4576_08000 [Desulfobacteraceae bacterium]